MKDFLKESVEIVSLYWELFHLVVIALGLWLAVYLLFTWLDSKQEKIHYEDRY